MNGFFLSLLHDLSSLLSYVEAALNLAAAYIGLITERLGIGICLMVMVGCVCRLDLFNPKEHKSGWSWMYMAFAVFALGVLLDLCHGVKVQWFVAVGVGGILVNLLLTWQLWRGSAPPNVQKKNSVEKVPGYMFHQTRERT